MNIKIIGEEESKLMMYKKQKATVELYCIFYLA